jgi:hypothetical protein
LDVLVAHTEGDIPVTELSALVKTALTAGSVEDEDPAVVITDVQEKRYRNAAPAGTTYRVEFPTLAVNPVVAIEATSEGIPPCTVAILLYVVVLAP